MNMDTARGRIFGLTWPTGRFFRFDLASRDMKDFGPVCALGENGKGPTYRTICRSIAVDPDDGSVYFTDCEGTIHRYRYDRPTRSKSCAGDNMKKDYFGLYDPTSPGHMGYNWRQVVWVHPGDDDLRRARQLRLPVPVRPAAPSAIEVLDRITSDPSHSAGMFDQFSYGYLGFTLGPDGRTLYYLTGGPVYVEGKRVAGKAKTAKGESKGIEDLHLITYDIPTERLHRPRADLLRQRRPAGLRQLDRGRQGRHRLHPVADHRAGQDADRPHQHPGLVDPGSASDEVRSAAE